MTAIKVQIGIVIKCIQDRDIESAPRYHDNIVSGGNW